MSRLHIKRRVRNATLSRVYNLAYNGYNGDFNRVSQLMWRKMPIRAFMQAKDMVREQLMEDLRE